MDTLTLKNKGKNFQEQKKARLLALSYCDLPLDFLRWQNAKEIRENKGSQSKRKSYFFLFYCVINLRPRLTQKQFITNVS